MVQWEQNNIIDNIKSYVKGKSTERYHAYEYKLHKFKAAHIISKVPMAKFQYYACYCTVRQFVK